MSRRKLLLAAARNTARFAICFFLTGFAASGLRKWLGWRADPAILMQAFVAPQMIHFCSVICTTHEISGGPSATGCAASRHCPWWFFHRARSWADRCTTRSIAHFSCSARGISLPYLADPRRRLLSTSPEAASAAHHPCCPLAGAKPSAATLSEQDRSFSFLRFGALTRPAGAPDTSGIIRGARQRAVRR